MTGIELVKEVFPNVSDEEADYILWERTGFPSFWKGDSAEDYFRKQLQVYKAAAENLKDGEKLCTLCNNVAIDNGNFPECQKCKDALSNARTRAQQKDI